MNAEINKNLVNDKISLELVKGSGLDVPPQPRGMPKWFKEWSDTVYQYQPPAWFKHWSETVYQTQQPKWFKDWSENIFKPTINDINKRLDQNGLKPLVEKFK